MIIFRPHRRMLNEAMVEAKEFETELAMKQYIVEKDKEVWGRELFSIDDIVIDDSSEVNDDRNGWEDTKYVCVKRMGDEDYIAKYGVPQCIGMCATKYKSLRTYQ